LLAFVRFMLSASRSDQARLVRNDHGLGAVAQVELGQQSRDVRAYRCLCDHQVLGDLGVRPSASDQGEDLDLSFGEVGEALRSRGARRRRNRFLDAVLVHPLYAKGYTSFGCAPCTRPISAGEDDRAGRWWWETGAPKECGIHCPIETGNFEHEAEAIFAEAKSRGHASTA
jgi:hypothetical protein